MNYLKAGLLRQLWSIDRDASREHVTAITPDQLSQESALIANFSKNASFEVFTGVRSKGGVFQTIHHPPFRADSPKNSDKDKPSELVTDTAAVT